jgi:hypothetical protein
MTALALCLLVAPAPVESRPYPQLPSERECEQACKDWAALRDWAWNESYNRTAAGANVDQYADIATEAGRQYDIWFACWYVQWQPKDRDFDELERDRWVDRLIEMIGPGCFWNGIMPPRLTR